ncbi:MAG: peptidoglycan DD-metalloendopeptidase family protein [Patescibacteria group bacterium]|jgi:murein DD-endopeptidase MepM/ murein hydrolase activator NlpD
MLKFFHKKTILDKARNALKGKEISIIIGIIILIVLGIWLSFKIANFKTVFESQKNTENTPAKPIENKKLLEINSGDTYGKLMSAAGIETSASNAIFKAAAAVYGLEKIRAGHALELIYDANWIELNKLVYKIDSEDEVLITKNASSTWRAEIKPIAYEVKTVAKSGEVKTSMYAAALENNIDERAIIALADAFQWTIDFALDPRVGDKFKFVYEERYLDGQYVMPGRVFAGTYINGDKAYNVYYFSEDKDNTGYFDENGNSAQKMFLKAPVSFKYISSNFTTGMRYVEAFNVSTGHRAVDYAATAGTPIRSVGDGTVVFASYNGAYGNMVKVQHNGTYTTNYGHMSKFAVKRGARVVQGQTIGYVGSTGFSTGPHLHFEMVKNGVKVNPLKEITPPGKAIRAENKERFTADIQKWQDMLR